MVLEPIIYIMDTREHKPLTRELKLLLVRDTKELEELLISFNLQ